MGVGQIQGLIVDLRLIAFDAALVLLDHPHLVFSLLPRDRILLHQGVVTLKVRARLIEKSLIVTQLPFVLFFQHLIGTRVDLGEEVAFLNHLPFLEGDLGQIAVQLRFHDHIGDGRHGAERVADDLDVAARDGRDPDRLSAAELATPRWPSALVLWPHDPVGRVAEQRDDQQPESDRDRRAPRDRLWRRLPLGLDVARRANFIFYLGVGESDIIVHLCITCLMARGPCLCLARLRGVRRDGGGQGADRDWQRRRFNGGEIVDRRKTRGVPTAAERLNQADARDKEILPRGQR